MRTFKIILLIIWLLAAPTDTKKITCPTMKCVPNNAPKKEHLEKNVCFKHDGKNPTIEFIGNSCAWHQAQTLDVTGTLQCEFDALSGKWAWI